MNETTTRTGKKARNIQTRRMMFRTDDDIKQGLGPRLRALRLLHGYRQKDVEEWLGFSDSRVYNWEMGNVVPHLSVLLRYCDYFKVTMDYFFTYPHQDEEQLQSVECEAKEEAYT